MMKGIIDLLNANEYYGVSEKVDFAKGRHAIPVTWKEAFKNIKRRIWQTRISKSK